MSYPPEYEEAWEERVLSKPWGWGLAPIHHGCFENGWGGALEAAAKLLDPPDEDSMASDEDLAAYAVRAAFAEQIRALGIWTPEDDEEPGL